MVAVPPGERGDKLVEALRLLNHRAMTGVIPHLEIGILDQAMKLFPHRQRQQPVMPSPQDERRALHFWGVRACVVAQSGAEHRAEGTRPEPVQRLNEMTGIDPLWLVHDSRRDRMPDGGPGQRGAANSVVAQHSVECEAAGQQHGSW